jgi:hypothetical protein
VLAGSATFQTLITCFCPWHVSCLAVEQQQVVCHRICPQAVEPISIDGGSAQDGVEQQRAEECISRCASGCVLLTTLHTCPRQAGTVVCRDATAGGAAACSALRTHVWGNLVRLCVLVHQSWSCCSCRCSTQPYSLLLQPARQLARMPGEADFVVSTSTSSASPSYKHTLDLGYEYSSHSVLSACWCPKDDTHAMPTSRL